jgi:hypothetical protein
MYAGGKRNVKGRFVKADVCRRKKESKGPVSEDKCIQEAGNRQMRKVVRSEAGSRPDVMGKAVR